MVAMDDKTIIKRAKKELVYALGGTGITLVCAIALYLWVPTLRMSMQTTDEHLTYKRVVELSRSSGNIRYTKVGDVETPESLKRDAEILQRRFERGNFQILTIAGSTIEKEASSMKKNKKAFRYNVKTTTDGATLEIKASNAQASTALNNYLSILKKHWKN